MKPSSIAAHALGVDVATDARLAYRRRVRLVILDGVRMHSVNAGREGSLCCGLRSSMS
jgi:hypothetical protein